VSGEDERIPVPDTEANRLQLAAIRAVRGDIEGASQALRGDPPKGNHEPGESHEYRIECKVCGQPGMVRVSIDPARVP
jgi:hypothetical protein